VSTRASCPPATGSLAGVITAWDRPNGFAWKPIAGPYEMSGGWTFEAEGSQTKVTRYSDTELSGFMKLTASLMGPVAKRPVRRELQRLKELVEAQTIVG
jgi:hypothetical protein